MADVFYRWPEAAKFARRVPKEKISERGTLNGTVRQKLTTEIQRITWAYKLAEVSINLPATSAVPEVEVFTIDAKGDDISEDVLGAIDRAIPFPILFEIMRHGPKRPEVRMVAAYKLLGAGAPKMSAYYSTGWQPQDVSRQALPTAITLPALYTAILQPLTPLAARPGEEVSDLVDRLDLVRKLEREVESLGRKVVAEPQLNRKVEIRRALRTKQHELTELVR